MRFCAYRLEGTCGWRVGPPKCPCWAQPHKWRSMSGYLNYVHMGPFPSVFTTVKMKTTKTITILIARSFLVFVQRQGLCWFLHSIVSTGRKFFQIIRNENPRRRPRACAPSLSSELDIHIHCIISYFEHVFLLWSKLHCVPRVMVKELHACEKVEKGMNARYNNRYWFCNTTLSL